MSDGVSSRPAGETMSSTDVARSGRGSEAFDALRLWLVAKSFTHKAWHTAWQYVIVPLGGGFALGRAVILGSLHPFGQAFVVGLAATGQRARSVSAAAGVLLAALTSPAGSPLDNPGAVLIFAWLFAAFAGHVFQLAPWVSATGALAGATTLRAVAAAFSGGNVGMALVAGSVDVAAAWFMLPVIDRLFGVRLFGREGRRASPRRRSVSCDDGFSGRRVSLGDRVYPGDGGCAGALLAFAGVLALGVDGLVVLGVGMGPWAMGVLTLVGAGVGGVGGGAATGGLLGLLVVLANPDRLWEAVALAVTGLGAGLGANVAAGAGSATGSGAGRAGEPLAIRAGAIVGLLLMHLLLAGPGSAAGEGSARLLHSVWASGALVFVPEGWLARLRRQVAGSNYGVPGWNAPAAAAAAWHGRLAGLAGAFAAASDALAGPAADGGQGAGDAEASAAAAGWREKGQEGDILESQVAFDEFVVDVRQQVCRGCVQEARCWETYGWQTYRDLLAFVADRQKDGRDGRTRPAVAGDLPPDLRQRCIQRKHFVQGVEKLLALVYDRARHERQLQQWQAPLQRKLSGLATLISGVAEEMSRLEKQQQRASPEGVSDDDFLGHHPRFQVQTDHVAVPGDAAVMSGDHLEHASLPGHRHVFIVCDGMGSGPRAAAESRAVAAMVRRFLEAGFDLRFSVETINAVMLLQAAEESFVTVDAVVVDLRAGMLHLVKTGAAPTYIHRGGTVEMIRADSLPVGILPAIEVFEAKEQLQLGDVVVMMSDGALDLAVSRGDKGEGVRRQLERLARPRPKDVVDALFSANQSSPAPWLSDDVTIVAAQLLPAVLRPDR